jgi:hypothetical protein
LREAARTAESFSNYDSFTGSIRKKYGKSAVLKIPGQRLSRCKKPIKSRIILCLSDHEEDVIRKLIEERLENGASYH